MRTHLRVSFSGRAPRASIDRALADIGRQRRIVLTVNQFFTAGRVVAQSDLLTVLPLSFLAATGYRQRARARANCRSIPARCTSRWCGTCGATPTLHTAGCARCWPLA